MKMLVACERSRVIADTFEQFGWEAWSADLAPAEKGNKKHHYQGDVLNILNTEDWTLLIAHPPCTYLTVSRNKYYKKEWAWKYPDAIQGRPDAIAFFMEFANAKVPHIAIENPVSIMASEWRPSDQTIQPYQYGHDHSKGTCLWLKNLPLLQPTSYVDPHIVTMEDLEAYSAKHKKPIEDIMEYLGARRWANQTLSGADRTSPGKERMMKRARTFQGIADAMAEQWTQFIASGGQTNPRRQLHLFSDVAEEVDPFCSAYAALRRKYDARTAFKLHEMYCGCRFVPQKEQAL